MHFIGVILARYIDWCAALSVRFRLWQLIAVELVTLFGLWLLVNFFPGWISIAFFFVVFVPVGIFAGVSHQQQRKQAAQKAVLKAQLAKTRKLLERFRK